MSKIMFILPIIMISILNSNNSISEELAPGYNACMEKAFSNVEMRMCAKKSYDYWDKKLNINYKLRLKECDNFGDSAEKCRNDLKKAERLFVQYKESMSGFIAEYCGEGTLCYLYSLAFQTSVTKSQAKQLQINHQE